MLGANLDFRISLPLKPVDLNLHVKPADKLSRFRQIVLDLPCLCIASVSQALTGLVQIVYYMYSTDSEPRPYVTRTRRADAMMVEGATSPAPLRDIHSMSSTYRGLAGCTVMCLFGTDCG